MSFSVLQKNIQTLFVQGATLALFLLSVWGVGNLVAVWLEPPVKVLVPSLQKLSDTSSVELMPQKPSFLFGQPEARDSKNKTELLNQDEIKQTRLNVKLTGVIYTPQSSVAVIESGRETFVLKEGEVLRQGITVEQIQPDFVVLNNRGGLERLMLEESDLPGKAVAIAGGASLNQGQTADLQKIRDEVRKSPLALNRYVRFRMLKESGQVNAIQVWPRRERQLFESLGFKNGDKILQVDGVAVSTLAGDPQQMQKLLQKSRFDLQIERSGQQQSLSVVLQ
ncbi:type II secretion system protein N [Thiomicrorhabdus sp. 6S3-12]|uniref:type II secretion system protein N n=1 Tax=Thiomicrorhabdus sp. 6S3-12 TaxID=2819681 RepID=UPI001AACEC99|nr:type II secretion system protein N [Thiomicrorhabdus sp. 6S3-12]MBO1923142.1 hypothetical protein [Thiomicrorhabdus sp. 6S3-12]